MRFFKEHPEVLALTTSCSADFSLAPGQADLTPPQKEYLRAELGCLPPVVNVRQVHGSRIIHYPYASSPEESGLPEADGIITSEENVAIVVRTADCVPVFFYDAVQKKIGIVHAGWQGSRKKIVKEAVRLMEGDPQNMEVTLGPAIQFCCYEVGMEVAEFFPEDIVERNKKIFLDLPAANRRQLRAAGVPRANILDAGECTCCNENYFSYRRQGAAAGRMLSVIMMKG